MKKTEKAIRKGTIKPDQDPLEWAKSVCAHKPLTDEQSGKMDEIKSAAIILICNIIQCCKPSSDRATAIRKVREALMFAKEAAVLDWENPT